MLLSRRLLTPRHVFPLIVGAVCLWLLSHRLAAVDLPHVWQALGDLSLVQWAMAGLATIGSLAAVGRYDVVIHRALGTGITTRAAGRSGVAAIALSQTIGFGVLSGALVRWRMLPELSLWQATKLTTIVAASFMATLAAFTALTSLFLKSSFFTYDTAIYGGILILLICSLVVFWSGRRIGRFELKSPNLLVIGALLVLVAIDTLLAALGLYWLLPEGTQISFALLLPAFLVALGVGMISGSPAGLGAFELTLLALLPSGEMANCLAAILAFRLIYYAIPTLLALIPLAAGGRSARPTHLPHTLDDASTQLTTRQHPEAAMLRQDNGLLLTNRQAQWGVRMTNHSLTAFGTPLRGGPKAALPLLQRAATQTARFPVLYKALPQTAAAARAAGWSVTRIAHEAILHPQDFSTNGSERRQLRRFLRKAAQVGLQTRLALGPLPEADMQAIHANWVARNGQERGFSMGRFDLPYLRRQRLYLGYQNGTLVAFISLHAQSGEWVLDLMRQAETVPSGTMHALICHALDDARKAGVARFSMAAVPDEPGAASGLEGFVRRQIWRASGADGLRRFKASFAPRWEPRYLATPRRWQSAVAIIEIGHAIQNPQAVVRPPRLGAVQKCAVHEHYENYEIESDPRLCEMAFK